MKIASMKKEKPSIAKPRPEDAPERGGERGPQQAHLEAEDRAGDHPDGEQRDHDPRPAARDRAVGLVAGALVQPLHEQHHRREGDAEAHERDVHGEGQRLHLARFEQVLLLEPAEAPPRSPWRHCPIPCAIFGFRWDSRGKVAVVTGRRIGHRAGDRAPLRRGRSERGGGRLSTPSAVSTDWRSPPT
jgi:hypothetical protein